MKNGDFLDGFKVQMDRDKAVTLFHKQNRSTCGPCSNTTQLREATCNRVALRPTGLSAPALQPRPPALTIIEKRISSFPMETLSKRTTKNKQTHAHESNNSERPEGRRFRCHRQTPCVTPITTERARLEIRIRGGSLAAQSRTICRAYCRAIPRPQ